MVLSHHMHHLGTNKHAETSNSLLSCSFVPLQLVWDRLAQFVAVWFRLPLTEAKKNALNANTKIKMARPNGV
jgi:hypothetical protein